MDKLTSIQKVCGRCGHEFTDMDDYNNSHQITIDYKIYRVCWVCYQQYLPFADEKQKLKEKMIRWIQRR